MLKIIEEYTRSACVFVWGGGLTRVKSKEDIFETDQCEWSPRTHPQRQQLGALSKGVCVNGWQRMRSKRFVFKRDAIGKVNTSRVSMRG
jgi:hypothetical protein